MKPTRATSATKETTMPTELKVTAADLRAEFARTRKRIYLVAGQINVHPSRLSLVLNERMPLTADLAGRISEALRVAK
jgi:hypothetical protein